jgi:hypothetical protein
MLRNIYIVYGQTREPELHVLSASEADELESRYRIARTEAGRRLAARYAFGGPDDEGLVVIPLRDLSAAQTLALEYMGPYHEAITGLAACVATGTPLPACLWRPDPDPGHRGGSDRVPVPAPLPVAPGGSVAP